jgi:hypothetical protein
LITLFRRKPLPVPTQVTQPAATGNDNVRVKLPRVAESPAYIDVIIGGAKRSLLKTALESWAVKDGQVYAEMSLAQARRRKLA